MRKQYLVDISELIGIKFGRLTILEDLGIVEKYKTGRSVLVECDCGNTKIIRLSYLKEGKTNSCGCLKSESSKARATTHGLYSHPIYKLWYMIKSRCYGDNKDYNGKGVIMCEEWKNNFFSFYNWALENGWAKGLQLDKDKLAPTQTGFIYSPEFCCFLTPKENMWYRTNSRMLEYNNETKCLGEWVDILGLDFKLTANRYKKGWDTKRNFETPCIEKFRNKSFINNKDYE